MKPPVIVRVFRAGKLLEVRQFDLDQVTVGSDPDVIFSVQGEGVSAFHCMIELRGSGYFLSDLGSAAGTRLNGKPCLDEALNSGDQIEVGDLVLQFSVGVAKPKPLQNPQAIANSKPMPTPVPPKLPEVKISSPTSVTSSAASSPPAFATPVRPASSTKAKSKSSVDVPGSGVELQQLLRPGNGPWVEVLVAWRERILSSQHFREPGVFSLGASGADLFAPSSFVAGKVPFLDTRKGVRVLLPPQSQAQVITERERFSSEDLLRSGKAVSNVSGATSVRLDQGEVLLISVQGGALQLAVRFCGAPPVAVTTGLDFSAGELTAVLVSMFLAGLFSLYIAMTAPLPGEEAQAQDAARIAKFVYVAPPTPPEPPAPKPKPVETPVTPPPAEVQAKETKDTPKGPREKPAVAQVATRANEIRPKPNSTNRPKVFTSAVPSGGAVKTSPKAGANASSADVKSQGMLSAFGSGGVRSQLQQAYQGGGDLLGTADRATGAAGMNENRAGNDIGSRFRDTGSGGTGTASQGIAGIGTQGRSSGQNAYGAIGAGSKARVNIEAGGTGTSWDGTIDREAVRRVIRSLESQIQSCFERQQRKDPSLPSRGRVLVVFEIHSQGRVLRYDLRDVDSGYRPVGECTGRLIQSQTFPEPSEGTYATISFPFLFQTGGTQ